VTTGAISRAKFQSNHHHQQTNAQFFYRSDALPVAQPTVSLHWSTTTNNWILLLKLGQKLLYVSSVWLKLNQK